MSKAQKDRWTKMTPIERTAQINAMHAGDEKQKYALISQGGVIHYLAITYIFIIFYQF